MWFDQPFDKKTATLIGLRRDILFWEPALYGQLQLKRTLCYVDVSVVHKIDSPQPTTCLILILIQSTNTINVNDFSAKPKFALVFCFPKAPIGLHVLAAADTKAIHP